MGKVTLFYKLHLNLRGKMEDVIRNAPLFLALDDEASVALRASMVEMDFARGQIIFSEGDAGDRLYVISEGKIKLGTTSTDGRENLLAILGPGEMFGELSLFDPGPRTATATALTETVLLFCRLMVLAARALVYTAGCRSRHLTSGVEVLLEGLTL